MRSINPFSPKSLQDNKKQRRKSPRRLRIEPLENRALLAVIVEAGDLISEIDDRTELTFEEGSYDYVAPNANQLADFGSLAQSLLDGDIPTADAQSAALDYELVEYTDTNTARTFYMLREELVDAEQTRGWGTYIIDLNFDTDVLVEAPHPLHDTHSEDVAIRTYLDAGARGFLLAGAHRHANGHQTADVAHIEDSIFHRVHEVWGGTTGDTQAWQIHGFHMDNHEDFPEGSDAVLSNGDGHISHEIFDLDERIDDHGWESYVHNSLEHDHAHNVQVNETHDGETFSSLAGSTNDQGIETRGEGGRFVHIELEYNLRDSQEDREAIAHEIAESIIETNSFFVLSAGVSKVGDDWKYTVDFSRPIDPLSVDAEDLDVEGHVATSVDIIDADTVSFTLPLLSVNDHIAELAQGNIESDLGLPLRRFDGEFTISPPEGNLDFVEFQQGVSGYNGTLDTYVDESAPSTARGSSSNIWVDADSNEDDEERNGLLRFQDIFGGGADQIPLHVTITSAVLQVQVNNDGPFMTVHRMLQSWDESTKWNDTDFGINANPANGIQADDIEAVALAEDVVHDVDEGILALDVFHSLVAWQSNPVDNHGWVFITDHYNGVALNSSEHESLRPKLQVSFVRPPIVAGNDILAPVLPEQPTIDDILSPVPALDFSEQLIVKVDGDHHDSAKPKKTDSIRSVQKPETNKPRDAFRSLNVSLADEVLTDW